MRHNSNRLPERVGGVLGLIPENLSCMFQVTIATLVAGRSQKYVVCEAIRRVNAFLEDLHHVSVAEVDREITRAPWLVLQSHGAHSDTEDRKAVGVGEMAP